MVSLIREDDRKIMAEANFVKNAVLYKDLFAFYDAYSFILSQDKQKLPNYCFLNNGNYCLEGICLLIKDYSSELGFESIKLTIDYLKVLYYTIASYSKDGNLPDKSIIEHEFEEYKKASEEISFSTRIEFNKADDKFLDAKSSYDKLSDSYGRKIFSSKILNVLSIVFLIAGIIFAGTSISLYLGGVVSMAIAIVLACIFLVFGIGLYVILKVISRRQDSEAGEMAYTMQGKKKSKDELESNRLSYLDKYNRITGEKYEYTTNFGELFNSYRDKLSPEEILKKSREYRLLSYNIRLDILAIASNQEREEREIIDRILRVTKDNSKEQFSAIYKEISKKDWLLYSNVVRIEFLKKFADISATTFNWNIESNDEIIRPFGIDIKAISKEKVVYLKSRDGLFVTSTLDKFTGTKYFKSLKELDMVDINNLEKIRNVKMEFYSHFFDYEKTKGYNNLFYSDKIEDGIKISDDILSSTAKIPTFVLLKLKLIESKLRLGNSDNPVVKQISEFINKLDGIEDARVLETKKQEEEKQVESQDVQIEEINEYSVKYSVEGTTFTGYKLSSI